MNNKMLLIVIAMPVSMVVGCSPGDLTTQTQPNNTTRVSEPQVTEPKTTNEEPAEAKSNNATDSPKAQLFENMGSHKRPITTSSPEAQKYFDQGLTWMYAFNHDEAIRSFKKASELDPECAMAEWGASLATGPQYNHAIMTENRIEIAQQAMEKAIQRIENTTPVERALIEALKHRNPNSQKPEDWTRLTQTYADAMEKIWDAFPKDAGVGSLFCRGNDGPKSLATIHARLPTSRENAQDSCDSRTRVGDGPQPSRRIASFHPCHRTQWQSGRRS